MRICKVDDCNEKHVGLGYCSRHYHMFKIHGNPLSSGYPIHSNTSEYISWHGAKQRCYDPKSKNYHRYGGRGIIMCDEWKNDFRTFLKDMGYKPFKSAQLDRIDNDGNYELGNCRWVTAKVNANNRSNSKHNKELTI